MNFKIEIKEASSSKSKLVFVKVPDGLQDLLVDNTQNKLSGRMAAGTSMIDWISPKIPARCKFIGYSHQLTDDEIDGIFSSRAEFYKICNYHQILYNYSAYTGKWAVLAVEPYVAQ